MIEHYQKEFPCLVSYNRFVELMSINFGFWILDFRLGKKNRRLWRGELVAVDNRSNPLNNPKSKI
jgi:hypothetical protein